MNKRWSLVAVIYLLGSILLLFTANEKYMFFISPYMITVLMYGAIGVSVSILCKKESKQDFSSNILYLGISILLIAILLLPLIIYTLTPLLNIIIVSHSQVFLSLIAGYFLSKSFGHKQIK